MYSVLTKFKNGDAELRAFLPIASLTLVLPSLPAPVNFMKFVFMGTASILKVHFQCIHANHYLT